MTPDPESGHAYGGPQMMDNPGWYSPTGFRVIRELTPDEIRRMRASEGYPANMAMASITSQVLEFSWDTAYMTELRDPDGKWSRSPKSASGFAVPDHDRLINTTARTDDYDDPDDHPFFKQNPVSADHVVAAWDAASPLQITRGMDWYSDAQKLAKVLGDGDVHKGAGVLSAYSPQSAWQVDMMNAAMALGSDKAIGGKGSGHMITDSMKNIAAQALQGKPTDEVFSAPKTRAFARLIEHGGDAPGEPFGDVVVDRHALSVAMGKVLPKKLADQAPLGQLRFYENIADTYRKAAATISQRDGIRVTPSQVQAATWLWRQELNQARDKAGQDQLERGRETAQRNAWETWTRYGWEHQIPGAIGTTSMPGSALAKEVTHSPDGFSVSMASGKSPVGGYMVALNDRTHTFPAEIMNDPARLADAIDQMLMSERDLFAKEGDLYLGGWVYDGKLWLEPSQNIADLEHAASAAKAGNQIAIWDVANGQEIQTGGTGGGRITEHDAAGRAARTYTEGSNQGSAGLSNLAPGRAPQGSRAASGRDQPARGIAAQFLDLAGDADADWRTEPRRPRGSGRGAGEWTRLISSQVPRETRPGLQVLEPVHDWQKRIYGELLNAYDTSDSVTAKNSISKAGTAFDMGEWEDAADNLVDAAGHAADDAQASTDIDRRVRLRDEADKLAMLQAEIRKMGWTLNALPEMATPYVKVKQLASKTASAVPRMFNGGRENWNGKISLFPQDEKPTVSAEIGWDGEIHYSAGLARQLADGTSETGKIKDARPWVVMLHELIHGLIQPGQDYSVHQRAYQNLVNASIEEGFTELGTIMHAAEYLKAAGVGDLETPIIAVENGRIAEDTDQAKILALQDKLRDWYKRQGEKPGIGAADAYKALADARNAFGSPDFNPDAVINALAKVADVTPDPEIKSEIGSALDDIYSGAVRTRHATASEYAERLNDPERIARGEAWGTYRQETAKALNWVTEVARAEGFADVSKGTPGWKRIVELADEVNRYGTAEKIPQMAEQVARAAGTKAEGLASPLDVDGSISDRHTPGVLSAGEWRSIEDEIRSNWEGSDEGGKSPFQKVWLPTFRATAARRARERQRGAA